MSIYDKASLVLIPSGSKTSKVYSQKPTNGDGDFTFSRSTAATRVNASGNIEKETQNLLTESNNFSDSDWTKVSASLTSGQSGYDGSSDAWLLSKSAGSARIQQNVSSGLATFSVYAKAGSKSWITLLKGGNAEAYINLSDGSIGYTNSSVIDATATSVGSGWYRCTLTYNDAYAGSMRIYPADGDGDTTGTSGNIYIQDAQLEQGLVARDYIETTTTAIYGGITDNVPRLDYTDSSCPALLLEPQRTNLLTQGEYFKSWSKTSASVTSNAATSPEGVQNASKLVEASGSSFHFIGSTPTIASGSVTFSFYAKSAERTSVSAFLTQSGNNGANFDLSAGTATAQGTGNTASIESVGDGWYRCVVTNSGSAQVTSQVRIGVQNGALDSYVGDGTSGIYIYGAQVEQGSYATSYIPTYGSAVTRNADVSQILSAADLIGQSEGTLYADFDLTGLSAENRFILAISNNNQSEAIFLRHRNSNDLQVYSAGLSDNFDIRHSISTAGNYKVAVGYKSGDIVFYVNGTLINTDASAYGTLDMLKIFLGTQISTGFELGGGINQALLFKTRLSNEELATLTTI